MNQSSTTHSDVVSAVESARSALAGRNGFSAGSLTGEVELLRSLNALLSELGIELSARDDSMAAALAGVRRTVREHIAVLAGDNPTCTCSCGDWWHTTSGCWNDLPPEQGGDLCLCAHRGGSPAKNDRVGVERELRKSLPLLFD